MIYKPKFVKAINKPPGQGGNGNDIWYREEIVALMEKHGMKPEDIKVIAESKMYRWYPAEVFAALEAPREA
jgi:hypothetical protein